MPHFVIGNNLLVKLTSNVLLYILITGLASTVDFQEFSQQFKRPKGLLIGIACQFVLVPACAYMSIKAFDVESVVGIPLLVVASSPGTRLHKNRLVRSEGYD